ncbi:MAG: DUF2070 family protein [Methanosarcinales archaeon Met12]|nr:MAG: DUF2070 family protein [Methanosarcinales archaeon Met12]
MVKEMDERTADLAKYLFEVPKWTRSLPFLLVFSIIVGMGTLRPGYGWLEGATAGLILIGIPSVISALITAPMARWFGGAMTLNRSSFLSLVGAIIIGVFSGAGALFSVLFNFPVTFSAYVMALGVVFATRMLILLAVSNNSVGKMIIPASLQTLLGGTFLLLYTQRPEYYINLTAGGIIFVFACHLFVRYVDAPIKKSFGVSGLDFIKSYISHATDGSSEMEEFFKKIGEAVDIPVTALNFRTDTKNKAMFVIPMVHPGPMGEIGGGNLPARVAESFDGLVFVPHGTAYHDFNLVSASEILKIISATERALSRMKYVKYGTKSTRKKRNDTCILGQRFGDSVLLTVTHSPVPADDIEFAVGLTAMAEARVKGAMYAALIDAHNCGYGSSKVITPGSRTSYDIIKASSDATEELLSHQSGEIRVGVSKRDAMYSREDGMGPLGIRVAVIEVFGQRTAYVLIDGNNMVMGLREAIIETLPVDEAEVMTTDSHVVNITSSRNFIGMKIDHDELIDIVREIVNEAVVDLEPVEVGMTTEFAEDVIIFGSYRTAQLASTINAIMAMGGAFAISIILLALALAVVVFTMTG